MEQTSVLPQAKQFPQQLSWGEISEPGAYVEMGSGDLYRIPQEALLQGTSPQIVKESRGASRMLKLSSNPFITSQQARILSAQHNVEPNF